MNLDDYSYLENDRRYVKPQIGLGERNAFIDNLRETWPQQTAQISRDTRNLGTHISSNLGGLGGGSSYFMSRYQTPQKNSMIADLRAVAQSQALQEAMNNELAKAKKRYQDAYRAAKAKEKKAASGNDTNELKVVTNYGPEGDVENTGNIRFGEEEMKETKEYDDNSSAGYVPHGTWEGSAPGGGNSFLDWIRNLIYDWDQSRRN